ncbi:hypothetical protein FHG87_015707 [Trinorchestia longiramus]|nr:hypothetical protein FHG87_015707 [Trinorchestia longiramus]
MSSDNLYLLPKNVVPSHYDLSLFINFEDLSFKGDVSIQVKITSPTKVIKLHGVGLSIPSASLTYNETSKVVSCEAVDADEGSQTISLSMAEELMPGLATLTLKSFTAPLDTQMRGLYRSKYTG